MKVEMPISTTLHYLPRRYFAYLCKRDGSNQKFSGVIFGRYGLIDWVDLPAATLLLR